jgi:hypothetical protein
MKHAVQLITNSAAHPNCEWIFRSGDPGRCVVDLALELRVDLIVISSHHAFWCDRFRRNNNNAAYILSHAPCPVLEVTDNGDSFLNDSAIPEVRPRECCNSCLLNAFSVVPHIRLGLQECCSGGEPSVGGKLQSRSERAEKSPHLRDVRHDLPVVH